MLIGGLFIVFASSCRTCHRDSRRVVCSVLEYVLIATVVVLYGIVPLPTKAQDGRDGGV